LYCPDCGYYEKEKDNLGRQGDFYTSVSVGSVFGELLATRLADWLDELDQKTGLNSPVDLVEAGAHHGQLALDILLWFREFRPDLLQRLKYTIFEPSRSRKAIQVRRLASFAENTAWCDRLAPESIRGVIFSNELLDSMPITRLQWHAGERQWREMGVALRRDEFVWSSLESPVSLPFETPGELLTVLPEGFIVEFSSVATDWWQGAARALHSGWLMTLDYGFESQYLLDPSRPNGTLRTYHHHRVGDNHLAAPGDQDLTAHVNFAEIIRAGERSGLVTDYFDRQAAFLGTIAQGLMIKPATFPPWTLPRLRQLRTLLHPENLGESFRVLVQRRS